MAERRSAPDTIGVNPKISALAGTHPSHDGLQVIEAYDPNPVVTIEDED